MDHSRNEAIGELRLVWTSVGSILKDIDGKMRFPPVNSDGGLYRFLVHRSDGSKAIYVGETEDLQRRFAQYRNPGPSQTTNLRIKALFIGVLSEGGHIEVDVVVDRAWIKLSGTATIADFKRKEVRRLFENFILATTRVAEVEDLNM